jgi:hypothetical protein
MPITASHELTSMLVEVGSASRPRSNKAEILNAFLTKQAAEIPSFPAHKYAAIGQCDESRHALGLRSALHGYDTHAPPQEKTENIGVCVWQDVTGALYQYAYDSLRKNGRIDNSFICDNLLLSLERETEKFVERRFLSFAFGFDGMIDFRKNNTFSTIENDDGSMDGSSSWCVHSIIPTATRIQMAELLRSKLLELGDATPALRTLASEERLSVFMAPCEVSLLLLLFIYLCVCVLFFCFFSQRSFFFFFFFYFFSL